MARVPKVQARKGTSERWVRGTGNRKQMAIDVVGAARRKARRTRVFELRAVWAASWEAIGEEVGVSGKQAKNDYHRACAEYGQESAAEHKAKANARFDAQLRAAERLLASLRKAAEGGKDEEGNVVAPDLEAASKMNSLLRTKGTITRYQAQMNGAYAPQVIEHKGTVDLTTNTPAKARLLIKDYFAGNVGVPEPVAASDGHAATPREGPARH